MNTLKKLLLTITFVSLTFSSVLADNNTTKVSLNGLTLGMSKEEVFKMKFKDTKPTLQSLDYIEKLYYRGLGEGLDKDFYQYKAKIADLDAYIWLWFSNDTSKLYAMRVEWRNPPIDVGELDRDISEILTKKYGDVSRRGDFTEIRELGKIKIMKKMVRMSIDGMYSRHLVAITYIDTDLQKKHKESIIPYKRPDADL